MEQALKKYNMGDEKTIKEIIAEVDTDKVLFSILFREISFNIENSSPNKAYPLFFKLTKKKKKIPYEPLTRGYYLVRHNSKP